MCIAHPLLKRLSYLSLTSLSHEKNRNGYIQPKSTTLPVWCKLSALVTLTAQPVLSDGACCTRALTQATRQLTVCSELFWERAPWSHTFPNIVLSCLTQLRSKKPPPKKSHSLRLEAQTLPPLAIIDPDFQAQKHSACKCALSIKSYRCKRQSVMVSK